MWGWRFKPESNPQTYNAELEYLKTLHERKVVKIPDLSIILMSEYLNSNQYRQGISFFETLLNEDTSDLSPQKKGLYLGCLGVLRATYAEQVPLLRRIGWVNDTIDLLESARELSKNNNFGIRFMTGVVYAQLPERFEKKNQAMEDLQWLLRHTDEAPVTGMLREVYFQLSRLFHRDDKLEEARKFLELSGYGKYERPANFLTSFAANADTGHTFHPRKLEEIIPEKVFALSGFEFTEYYFIVSENGEELISIDAGTRPDSAQSAYEYLMEKHPNLPPLTTVFVTHAHWDHIGGHRYFRGLNPEIKFYSRDNYQEELDRVKNSPMHFQYFFGKQYNNELIADYVPDLLISNRTEINIGGTKFDIIPIPGGETPDGLFVYLPQHSVVFVADFIMPYLGAPFVEEGSLEGLSKSVKILADLHPTHVLHGHETLTEGFNPPEKLTHLIKGLEWLEQEVYEAIDKGMGRPDIHHLNLIPPQVIEHSDTQLIYLVMRENVINRIFDQRTGYWHSDLTGMDYLNAEDYGALLSHYLELSEKEIQSAMENMMANGDHYLAARTAMWAVQVYPESNALRRLKNKTFIKLKVKYQFFDPFKTIIFSEMSGHETPQLILVE